jgi:thiol-disulfide isomerase/thioredoxin
MHALPRHSENTPAGSSLLVLLIAVLASLYAFGGDGPRDGPDAEPIRAMVPGLPERVTALALGDVNGDGRTDLVSGDGRWRRDETGRVVLEPGRVRIDVGTGAGLRLLWSSPVPAPLAAAEVVDLTGDGLAEVVLVLGWQQYVEGASVHLWVLCREQDGFRVERPWTLPTERSQETFLQPTDLDGDGVTDLQLGAFDSRYHVRTVQVRWMGTAGTPGSWRVEEVPRVRMGMSRLYLPAGPDGTALQIVGRVYGDSLGTLGDLFVERPGGNQPLPAWQGVNALTAADLDGDGRSEVVVADGWHMDYGRLARARVAALRPGRSGWSYQLIEDVPGFGRFEHLRSLDLDGDGRDEVLGESLRGVRIWRLAGHRFQTWAPPGVGSGPLRVGDLDGDGDLELVAAGEPPVVLECPDPIPWRDDLGGEFRPRTVVPEQLVGRPAPPLGRAGWIGSPPLRLSGLRGKVVVLDFWATWCVPCADLYPVLSDWRRTLGRDGLVVIGLTRLDDRQSETSLVRSFVAERGLDYPVAVLEDNRTHLAYGVEGIPHTVIIGPDGRVRWWGSGSDVAEAAGQILRELLLDIPEGR